VRRVVEEYAKLTGVQILLSYCLSHGRRQFVDIAPSFPEECRYVLEALGEVYYNDAQSRKRKLSSEERLLFHQERSGPVMKRLKEWLAAHLAEHRTEPNSGLGKAITYLLRHWTKLTLFLRQQRAPLDNNVVTAASGSLQSVFRSAARRRSPQARENPDPAAVS
jgi:transposase